MPIKPISIQLNDYEILTFNKDIEQTDYQCVVESICQTVAQKKLNIILDFSDVSITSGAIKAIIKTHKILKNIGKLVVYVSKSGFLILDKTNLTTIISCFNDLQSLQNHLKLKKLSD